MTRAEYADPEPLPTTIMQVSSATSKKPCACKSWPSIRFPPPSALNCMVTVRSLPFRRFSSCAVGLLLPSGVCTTMWGIPGWKQCMGQPIKWLSAQIVETQKVYAWGSDPQATMRIFASIAMKAGHAEWLVTVTLLYFGDALPWGFLSAPFCSSWLSSEISPRCT